MRALGISRSEEFSPNSVEKDRNILHAVGRELQQHGEVSYLSENELTRSSLEGYDVVFSMGRKTTTVQCLYELQRKGVLVVNPSEGILNSERFRLSECFLQAQIPSPQTLLLPALPADAVNWPYPCWLKRADACAQLKEDVQYLENEQEAEEALQHFRERGIKCAVVTEHLSGDLVKFYGVEGTGFFHWCYPDIHKTKFGLEEKNGEAVGYPFQEEEMKKVCDAAARALSLPVYGGDCVVDAQGTFRIIDFNDWPSFSACCDAAGKAIAEYITVNYERNKKRNELDAEVE